MKKFRVAHVLPAVVVAVLLGSGTAYATTVIYTNNIANNAVTAPKLAPAVRSSIANDGLTHYRVVTQYVTVPAGNSTKLVDVKCPVGEVAIGGGAHYDNTWSPSASVKLGLRRRVEHRCGAHGVVVGAWLRHPRSRGRGSVIRASRPRGCLRTR